MHPQSDRPFEILHSAIPDLDDKDIILGEYQPPGLLCNNSSFLQNDIESFMGLEEAAELERRSGVAEVENDDEDEEDHEDDDCGDDGDKIDRMLRRKLLKQQREMLAPVAIIDDTPKEKIIEVSFINDRIPSYILVITKVYTSKKPAGEEGGKETPTLGTPI